MLQGAYFGTAYFGAPYFAPLPPPLLPASDTPPERSQFIPVLISDPRVSQVSASPRFQMATQPVRSEARDASDRFISVASSIAPDEARVMDAVAPVRVDTTTATPRQAESRGNPRNHNA